MSFTPSNGARLFIGGPVSELIDSVDEYAGLTWIEIKGLKSLGAFGDTATPVTSKQLNRNREIKKKGTFDGGSPAFVVDMIQDDPGQMAVEAALPDPSDYAFKVEIPNRLNKNGSNGLRYFSGQVMSFPEEVGAADSPITSTFGVGVNTPILKVAPTSGV